MIIIFTAVALCKHFNLLELDLEKHATKTKVLSLELETAVSQSEYTSPAHIEFLSEKIHLEIIAMDKNVSEF